MAIRFYNSLTRKKEDFRPLHKGRVGLYTCGPTVYNYVHIGNLRTYIFEDILRRTLEYGGFRLKHVMNITDVGHLTSDADEGEDKIEKSAKSRRDVQAIAHKYTNAFFQDLTALNVEKPHVVAPATKFIHEQIELVKKLIERGLGYETAEAVYFDVSKFSSYAALSGRKMSEQTIGARAEVVTKTSKRNPYDFALWFKAVGKFSRHLQRWPSPWGTGFPGWHIECSAISTKFLGQPFDIHTGGVDHIGTHHTNEIAQSEGAFGRPLARYWLHGEFLHIAGGRMGKSVGNFIRIYDLISKGYDPIAFRYLVLTAHYRSILNFSWESLDAAKKSLDNLKMSIRDMRAGIPTKGASRKIVGEFREQFDEAIFDDLNTPKALVILRRVIDAKTLSAKQKIILLKRFDEVLGLNLGKAFSQRNLIPAGVRKLVKDRDAARKLKDWKKSDELRRRLENMGWEIKDTPKGSELKKI